MERLKEAPLCHPGQGKEHCIPWERAPLGARVPSPSFIACQFEKSRGWNHGERGRDKKRRLERREGQGQEGRDGIGKGSCHIALAQAFLSVPNIGIAVSTDIFDIVPLLDIFLILLSISPGPSSSVLHPLPFLALSPCPATVSSLNTVDLVLGHQNCTPSFPPTACASPSLPIRTGEGMGTGKEVPPITC